MSPLPVTSSTRPSAPWEGQTIYETDTDKVLVWNGTAWYPNWNLPWGVQGYTKRTTGNTTATTSFGDVTGASATFTAVTGRAYKVTFQTLFLKNTSTGSLQLQITDGTPTTLYQYDNDSLVTSTSYSFCYSAVVTGLTAGTQTLKIRVAVSNNTGTIYGTSGNPFSFIVEDIGPA
jgi:hypothetical protein